MLIIRYIIPIIIAAITLDAKAQVCSVNCYDQNNRVLSDSNNLILNGGFENSTCLPYPGSNGTFCPNSTHYTCNIANWICTGGGTNTYAGIVDSSWARIIEGTKAVYFGNWFSVCACSNISNDISCFQMNDCVVKGIPSNGYPLNLANGYGGDTGVSLSQTISGLIIGAPYALEFWAGGEWEKYEFHSDGLFAIDVGFGNIFLRDPTTALDSGVGRRFVITFIASSSSHTIKFTNWGHLGQAGYYTELILDDVRMFSVSGTGPPTCATAINELKEDAVATIFPNPFHTSTTLQTGIIKGKMNIYNALGMLMRQEEISNKTIINRNSLGDGLYFYQLIDNKGHTADGRFVLN